MMSSDHGKMPVPLFGKIAAALVKSLVENALKPLLLFAAHPRAEFTPTACARVLSHHCARSANSSLFSVGLISSHGIGRSFGQRDLCVAYVLNLRRPQLNPPLPRRFLQPESVLLVGDFTGGEAAGENDGFRFGGGEIETVDAKKSVGGDKAGPFIPVNEGMIFDDAEGVSSGHFVNVRLPVSMELARLSQGGLQYIIFAEAGTAAETRQELRVDGEDGFPCEPAGFVAHLANSRSALR